MGLHFPEEWTDYTNQLVSHVKFKYDHREIRMEYLEHMEDMYEFYVGRGMSADQAKSAVLEDMGDADELGRVLNQIHNPVLGWIWRLSRWLVVLLVTVLICTCGYQFYDGLFSNMGWLRTSGNPVYTVDLNEKEVLDYRMLHFTKLEVYESGEAVLYYTDYVGLLHPFEAWPMKWDYAEITDGYGKVDDSMKYGDSRRGWIRKNAVKFGSVRTDSDMITIDYDWNRCQFTLEIPLSEEK